MGVAPFPDRLLSRLGLGGDFGGGEFVNRVPLEAGSAPAVYSVVKEGSHEEARPPWPLPLPYVLMEPPPSEVPATMLHVRANFASACRGSIPGCRGELLMEQKR